MRYVTILFALTALSQDMPEVHGTVTEFGTNAPIAAAEVILSEFIPVDGVIARVEVERVLSDSRGTFTLKPQHPGNYFTEATKLTYLTGTQVDALGPISDLHREEIVLTITRDPVPDFQFILVRPGKLSGVVVDEDGKPVPNFRVVALAPLVPENRGPNAVTNQDGVFEFPTLFPGPRVILAAPEMRDGGFVKVAFTKEDAEQIERDVETSYWPGGVPQRELALPINLIPGATVSVGTIRLRKVPYYRARLTYSGECAANESWQLVFQGTVKLMLAPCAKEFLLEKLSPGSYTLNISPRSTGLPLKWALTSFTIDRENVAVPVTFFPSIDVVGRVVDTDGKKVTGLQVMRILAGSAAIVTAAGDFTMEKVAGPSHRVSVQGVPANLAVKEIRYNNQPVIDGTISVTPGAMLEIVVDDRPASIIGVTNPGTRVYIAKAPYPRELNGTVGIAVADSEGRFRIGSLAAGDYRVIAVPAINLLPDAKSLARMWPEGQKVTLDRGAQQTIDLKLPDPSR